MTDELNEPPAGGTLPPGRSGLFETLLLFSGFCGISYEILYGRILSNFVGDQFAVTASVLLTFLLGIGVGTLYAHRFWPFLWLIEGGIGLCGALVAVGSPYLDTWLYAGTRLGGGLTGAIVVCFLVLSIPAFLIGCSLPLFAGYLGRLSSDRVFSRAYTVYNFGAAATVVVIEFWLVRWLGIRGAMLSIAAINAVVALTLLIAFRRLRHALPEPERPASFAPSDLIALATASIGSAIFQLLMVKLAECVLGPFRETFALVLALILLGLALGAGLVTRLRPDFGRLMLLALASLAWLVAGFGVVTRGYASIYPSAVDNPTSLVLLKLGTLAVLMLPVAIAFGATIPALATSQSDVARESGRLLFVSSIANAGGFLLMALVLHRYVDYGILVVVVAALAAVAAITYARARGGAALAAAGLLAVVVVGQNAFWDENLLYLGHRSFHSPADLKEARADIQFPEKFKGAQDVFALTRTRSNVQFFINGYISLSLGSPVERLVGAFPAFFVPRTDRALVLGLGSGTTGGTVALIFDRTDAVEINPVVVQNLHRMAEYNFNVHTNSKAHIVVDDGIHFMKVAPERYTLILNTVTSPIYFSSSKLYTRDFFEAVRRRLTPDGIYVTWIDSRIGDRGMDIILGTLDRSFPHCWMGAVKATYFVLMCSPSPIALRQPRVIAANPVLSDYFFGKHGLRPDWLPFGLVSTRVLTLRGDRNAPVNSLDHPVLEFEMARLGRRGFPEFRKRLLESMSLEEISAALKPAEVDPLLLVLHADILLGDSTVTDRVTALAKQRVKDFDVRYGKVKLEYYASHAAAAKTATAYRKYGSVLLAEDRYQEAVKQFRAALTIDANTDNAYFNMGAAYERSGQLEAALESYTNELKVDPTDDEVPFRQGRVAYKLKRYEQALAYLSVAARVRDTANTQFYRGLTLEALERFKEAQAAFQEAVEIDHDHRGAREGVARAAAAVMRGGR